MGVPCFRSDEGFSAWNCRTSNSQCRATYFNLLSFGQKCVLSDFASHGICNAIHILYYTQGPLSLKICSVTACSCPSAHCKICNLIPHPFQTKLVFCTIFAKLHTLSGVSIILSRVKAKQTKATFQWHCT